MRNKVLSVVVLLMMLVLAACASVQPEPVEPAEPVDSAGAAGGTSLAGSLEVPEVLFVYEREGGIAGFCDTLTVRADEAQFEDCAGQSAVVQLPEAISTELMELINFSVSFEETLEDNPGGADNLVQRINFYGIGDIQPTEEVVSRLTQIGDELIAQAMEANQ